MAGFPDKLPGDDFINSWYPILIAVTCGVLYGLRSYFRGAQCSSDVRLKGKTAIVTGGNRGIGKEVVKDLANRGAKVILACRDVEEGKKTIEEFKLLKTKTDKITVMQLDVSSLKSVREFVEKVNEEVEGPISLLINNAGVMCHPQAKSEDGFEYHFATNYLGPLLLTQLLLPKLKESEKARIVNVTALGARLGKIDFDDLHSENKPYAAGESYSQSKLAVVLATRKLAKELEGTNVTVSVIHPGIVNTDVYRHMPFRQSKFISVAFSPFIWMLMKTARDGAQTVLFAALAKEEEGVSGKYYAECQMTEVPEETWKDDEAAEKLWGISMKLLNMDKKESKKDS